MYEPKITPDMSDEEFSSEMDRMAKPFVDALAEFVPFFDAWVKKHSIPQESAIEISKAVVKLVHVI